MVAAVVAAPRAELALVADDGGLDRYFHPGQWRAHTSTKRFILVLAGTQGGKTSYGPHWLHREIQDRGPGEYLVATPTFVLLETKALAEFRRLFEEQLALGSYQASPSRRFVVSPAGEVRLFGVRQTVPTVVRFGYAEDPDSLESATYRAAWLDEAGQKKFKFGSWHAILRRLSLAMGRVLLTTTPYSLGWLKTELFDPWQAGNGEHPEIDIINFPSIANPQFPREEFERARRTLPAWQFRMFYLGLFERPAGLIYDCWDDSGGPDSNVIPAFDVPAHWTRFLGMDFGGVNMAGLFVAKELTDAGAPTGRYIGFREYHSGGRTIADHVSELRKGERGPIVAIGGAKSEDQYRRDFANAGLGIWEPIVPEVENGILSVYAMVKARQFVVMDSLRGFRDQMTSYSRELDERGEPTEKIEDKETYHLLDCARYLCPYLSLGIDGGLMS